MKRLLYVSPRLPYPPDKGDRTRAYHELEALAEHFSIDVACLHRLPADPARGRELVKRLVTVRRVLLPALGRVGSLAGALGSLLAGRSVTAGFFSSSRVRRQVARSEPYDVVLGYTAAAVPLALAAPAATRVIDLVDSDSAKWAHYARFATPPRRWLWRHEARAIARLEQAAARGADAVFFISRGECEASRLPAERLHVACNGVDGEFFAPPHAPAEPSPPTVVFTGTMSYPPNVDAVVWFAREVMPWLRRELPDLRFLVVGREPKRAVRRLATLPGVVVTGAVDDVRQALADAHLAVVPLRFSFGLPNKLLEAMATGRPVVSSPQALTGLELGSPPGGGEEAGIVEVPGFDPQLWSRTIAGLLRDAARRRELAARARQAAVDRFGWPSRLAPLVAECLRLAGTQRADPARSS